MSLENTTTAVELEGQEKDVKVQLQGVLDELQGLSIDVVDGDTANTNIAISGITTNDTLLSVIRAVGGAAGTPDVTNMADATSEASITSDGNIQLDTTDTSNDNLIVVWFNKS